MNVFTACQKLQLYRCLSNDLTHLPHYHMKHTVLEYNRKTVSTLEICEMNEMLLSKKKLCK